MPADILHIAPDSSSAGTLRLALPRPQDIIVSDINLACGPLVDFESTRDWWRIRREFWNAVGQGELDFCCSETFTGAVSGSSRALAEAGSVWVWVSTNSSEQLLIVWLLRYFQVLGVDPKKIQIIQFVDLPAKKGSVSERKTDRVLGLGFLTPEQLHAHPEPRPLSAEDMEELALAWNAVSAPDVAQLCSFLSHEPQRFPFLAPALRPLLGRFPDSVSGLSNWDRRVLEAVGESGPTALRAIGAALLAGGRGPDRVCDDYLVYRLRRLASEELSRPLATYSGELDFAEPTNRATLTDFGRQVLRGEANAVEVNGIDDWVLGVHLSSADGNVWFRDGEKLIRRSGV